MTTDLQPFDPFGASSGLGGSNIQQTLIHIRIQQRNGRKTLTTVQGVAEEFDLKKIVKQAKKEFSCNGTVVEHPEYGEVIQLQGDQRESIKALLIRTKIATPEYIKLHGF